MIVETESEVVGVEFDTTLIGSVRSVVAALVADEAEVSYQREFA